MSEIEQIRQTVADLQVVAASFRGMLDRENSYKEDYLSLKKEVDEKLLKQCVAAEMLCISDATLLKARVARKIKAVLIGKTWMYPFSEVLKYKSRKY